MKKVGAPGGFAPTLKKLVDSASKEGKQIGAPKLNKAIHGLHLGQLKKADQKQLRDFFESAPLTPKARALMEKLLGTTTTGGGINPGVVKIKADLPTTTPTTGGTIGTTPGVVKIKADLPTTTTTTTTTGGTLGTIPGVVKVKADLPTT